MLIYIDDIIKHLNKMNRYGVKCYLFNNIYNRNDGYYRDKIMKNIKFYKLM